MNLDITKKKLDRRPKNHPTCIEWRSDTISSATAGALINSWGYHVNLHLGESQGDQSAGASLFFTIPSGLDLPVAAGGMLLDKHFVPRDTLEEPFCWDSSSSSSAGSTPRKSFFMTKAGAPRWPETEEGPEPVVAYGPGDLKSLPPNTSAIRVESREIYDGDLAVLGRFTGLQVLDLGEAEGITDSGLRQLGTFKQLKRLTLAGDRLSGLGFRHLLGLPKLTDLKLYSAGNLTDKGIAAIADIPHLNGLTLWWAKSLTDDQLAVLARQTALERLKLWGAKRVTDEGLRHVASLAHLKSFSLSAGRVTPKGVACLVSLKNLEEISLGYMPLKDDALLPLSRLDSLEYVDLHGIELTDNGIQVFRNLPRLKRLYLDACGNVTSEGLSKLKVNLRGNFEVD